MSGKIKECWGETRRKLGHGVAFYKIFTLGAHSIAKKRNLSTKNNLVALPSLPKLSVKFQRNQLPNVQDITFSSVRPSPKICLINLFMSSLSPATLKSEPKGNISLAVTRPIQSYLFAVNLEFLAPLSTIIFFKTPIALYLNNKYLPTGPC